MSQVYLAKHRGSTNWGDGKSNQMLVFGEWRKPEYPGKNLSEQSREPTNSTHILHPIQESNPGHIGVRPVLSPLRQHCSQLIGFIDFYAIRVSMNQNELLLLLLLLLLFYFPFLCFFRFMT